MGSPLGFIYAYNLLSTVPSTPCVVSSAKPYVQNTIGSGMIYSPRYIGADREFRNLDLMVGNRLLCL